MNEVTRPTRPWGSISSAAATVAALAVFLLCASVAAAASEPLTGGTTSLTLKNGFAKKLNNNDVKVLKQGSGKVIGGTIELGISGGSVDTAAGSGSIANDGGFKLKHGKKSISITTVGIDLTGKSVSAKVGGKSMTLGSLSGVSVSQTGVDVSAVASTLKLSGAAARAINGKLGLDGTLKGGNAMSDARSKAQVKAATPASLQNDIAPPPPPAPQSTDVTVMTRNLYLGADLTPAIVAPNLKAFVAATGKILRDVTHNDFPTRAEGLADEILEKEPDLVGLQEVALWRTAPVNFGVLTGGPSATTVRYDYLQELMDELNAGGTEYEVVIVQNEFDLEAPADEDNEFATGPEGADINGRLTMRDVILAKTDAGIVTSNAKGANFKSPLVLPVLGNPLAVKRGWTSVDVSVRGSRQFRFINTHLEAFHPVFRAVQAEELVVPSGPATTSLPVVLLGDLNTDDDTVHGTVGIDQLAYVVLESFGMVERSTATPLSCCLKKDLLAVGDGGLLADFDHQVDHIMTRDPAEVLLKDSSVTGLTPANGFWDSDHAGVFSTLEILP
jgi:endonuclease/exonuclease/phosphatase family metal-dependent hydrolase